MRIVRGVDAPRVRWRNDGGWTRELLREPAAGDDFSWRASVADVEADGPFSRFDGCDRILRLLDGAGMRLEGDVSLVVVPGAPVARFAGEASIVATLVDGPTTDFNLIWRRDAVEVTVSELDPTAGVSTASSPGATVLAFVRSGSVVTPAGDHLSAGDLAVVDGGEALHVHGAAEVTMFLLAPRTVG